MLSKLPKLKDSIQKIDELCSVIFSVAFSFLLTYAYVALFNSIYLLVFNLLSDYVQWYILLIPAFFIAITMLIQIVITMLANLKSNKANKTLQTGYFKITLFSYVIMFGPTYKAVLQVFMIFGSNFKKKKHMVYLLLSFLLFGVFTSVYQLTNTNILYLINRDVYLDKAYAAYYKTENKEVDFLLNPEIESDKIESNVMKVFIPIFRYENKIQQRNCTFSANESQSDSEPLEIRKNKALDCYQEYNFVSINGQQETVDFLNYEHPITGQSGIVCYLDVSALKRGMHHLKIKKTYEEEPLEWSVPFYYASKN